MATPAEVRELFYTKLRAGIPNPPGEFHPLDLERVKSDDYLNRILAHQGNDVKLAAEMLWEILTWRKNVGANDINETNINMDYINGGNLFPHGRDLDNCLILIFKSNKHVKGKVDMQDLKRVVIYWFDRIERENNGDPITLFFDMAGCGLDNIDMEFTKYLILLMKNYYPNMMHMIILFEMPWLYSPPLKVIKALLPAKAVERMKTVTKDTLHKYINPNQALVEWGGTDDYVFEFVPETKTQTNDNTKKVTFAEQGDHSPGEMLRITPNDTIIFNNDKDEIIGQFTIFNMDDGAISFKIRTTSPEKFRVRPSNGTLAAGESQTVLIVVQQGFSQTINRDRFLVMSIQIPKPDINLEDLTEMWKNVTGSKKDEYKLKCHYAEKDFQKNGGILAKEKEENGSIITSLSNLELGYKSLNRQVKFLVRFQFFTFTILILFISYMVYEKISNNEEYCSRPM